MMERGFSFGDILAFLLFVCLGMVTFSCDSSSPHIMPDSGVDANDGSTSTNKSSVSLSNGSGATSSLKYKGYVHIGAPQPYGYSESPKYKIHLGPNTSN